LSGKQLTILPNSRQPNLTKLEHNTSIGVAMKTFGTEVCFFQKKNKKIKKCKTI